MEFLFAVLLAIIFSTPLLFTLYIKISIKFPQVLRNDRNKPEKKTVPTSGGFILLPTTTCIFVAFLGDLGISFALAVLIAGFIGLIDDIKGVGTWIKVPLMMLPSLPIIAFFSFGRCQIDIPWPLSIFPFVLLIPLITSFFSNAFNIISGYDGMSPGIGVIQLGALGTLAVLANNMVLSSVAMLCLLSIGTLLLFNWFPSRVFPGNSGTFIIGTLVALLFIYGGFWIPLIILFLPHILEFLLKIRFRGRTEVFGTVDEIGFITYHGRPKSVIHFLIMCGRWTEAEVSTAFLGLEVMLSLLVVLLVFF